MQIQTHQDTGDAIERTVAAPTTRSETRARMVTVTPAVDIFENAEELQLVTDLPGVPSDAIELTVDHGVLTLCATHEAKGRVYRRAFTLAETIDPSGVEADLKDGVLTVHLAKREDMKPRRVSIRSGG